MENKLNESLFGGAATPDAGNKLPDTNTHNLTALQEQKITTSELSFIEKHINDGGNVAIVPKGSTAVIVRTEFNPEIKKTIDGLTTELTTIGAIVSQETAAKANAVLAKAKKLIKSLSEERKFMTSVLDDEKKRIMAYEENIIGQLSKYVDVVNTNITNFQKEELRKTAEREAELKKKRDEEVEAARVEAERKSNIQKMILDFENSVLKACGDAKITDIDDKIKRLASMKINKDTYMEFLPEAEIMYQRCVTRMNERKTELMQLAEAEKKNSELAAKLKAEQDAKAALELEAQQQKNTEFLSVIEEEKQNSVANTQMNYEFKAASGEKVKGIMQKWVFDADTIDMSLLPEEYKTADLKKIKEAISEGCRDIPGVVIRQEVINVSK